MYLQQSQGVGLQAYFNQMQIAEASYPAGGATMDPAAAAAHASPQGPNMSTAHQPHPPQQQQQQQVSAPQVTVPYSLNPLMEPGEALPYESYMSHHQHYTQHMPPPGSHLHHHAHHPPLQDPSGGGGLGFGYPTGCEQQQLLGLPAEHYEFPLDPALLAPPLPPPPAREGGAAAGEVQGPLVDSEMMETVDSQQHGFVLVN